MRSARKVDAVLAALLDAYTRPAHLRIAEAPEPPAGAGQIRIAVRAIGINPRDWLLCEGRYVFRALVPGFPKIPGSDVSGVVDQVGPGVERWQVGDEVVAMQTPLGRMGGYAEKMVVDQRAVGHKPRAMSFEEAAGLPVAGLTALQMLRDEGALQRGERVVVVGASGGVGHYAVQIAKHLGAEVLGVCSAANAELVRELGADRVIDYRSEDIVRAAGRVDLVADALGRGSLAQWLPALAPGGRYVTTVPTARNLLDTIRTPLRTRRGTRSRMILCRSSGEDLDVLARLADAGRVRTYIDEVFALADVDAALAKSRTFRVRGKLILRVG